VVGWFAGMGTGGGHKMMRRRHPVVSCYRRLALSESGLGVGQHMGAQGAYVPLYVVLMVAAYT
jgi:hypothetical protein